MAKRKEQYRKQQVATVGHSDKFSRRMKTLRKKNNQSKGVGGEK